MCQEHIENTITVHDIPFVKLPINKDRLYIMVHDLSTPVDKEETKLAKLSDVIGTGASGLNIDMVKLVDYPGFIGTNQFQSNNLIGATGLFMIVVDKMVEFVGIDFTFIPETGTIERTNEWYDVNVMMILYQPKID